MASLYLVGIGPGDPELVTVKAVRLLQSADIIYVPQSNAGGRSVAEQIIAPYADREKLRPSYFPMVMDADEELDRRYTELAREVADNLTTGLNVVYVTLGDSMLYSTAQYLGSRLKKLGIRPEYVAGIPSYVACANRTGISLGEKSESFIVARMPESAEEVEKLTEQFPTVVLMKISKRVTALLEYVNQHRPDVAVLIHRLSLDGEEIIDLRQKSEISESVGYLSVAIIKKKYRS